MALAGNVVFGVFIVVGLVLLVAGCVLIPVFANVLHTQIVQEVPLKQGSESFKTWKNPPAPVYMQFYVFDVQNGNEIINNGAKPIVIQKGPYTYREIRTKENITFHKNGTRLSYDENKAYVFVQELSPGLSESDSFTSVNLPVLTVVDKASALGRFAVEVLADFVFEGDGLFTQQTVGGYLWGYTDPVLGRINNFTLKYLGRKILEDKFGLFYGATGNGTNDGVYDISTGTDDVAKLNVINKWKGSKTIPYWSTSYCNMINGTDGTMWHPYVSKSETLYLFSSDICRSIYVTYQMDHAHKNIQLLRFVPPASVFARKEVNPANAGFCTNNGTRCFKSGVLDVSGCKGAPIMVSQPHFYQGDQGYIDAITGILPEKDQHETFLDVEPYTGAVMNVAKKLQLNAYITPVPGFSDTDKMNATIFPIVWLNESAVIDDSGVHKFRDALQKPLLTMVAVQYGLIAAGGFILFCCLVVLVHRLVRSREGAYSHLETPINEPGGILNNDN